MKKTLTLAVLAISLAGCESLLKKDMKGTYVLVNKPKTFSPKKLEFTSTKVMIRAGLGDMAYSYKVEDGYVFVMLNESVAGWKYRQIGSDTLINDDSPGLEGVYVRKD